MRQVDAPVGAVVRSAVGSLRAEAWVHGTVIGGVAPGAVGCGTHSDRRAARLVVSRGDGTRDVVNLASVEVHKPSAACARSRTSVPDSYVALLDEMRSLPHDVRAIALSFASRVESIVVVRARAAANHLRDHPFPTQESRKAAVRELVPTIGTMLDDDLHSFAGYIEAYYAEVEDGIENSKCGLQYGALPQLMRGTIPFLTGLFGKLVGVFPPTTPDSTIRGGDPFDASQDVTMRKVITLGACMVRLRSQKGMPLHANHGALVGHGLGMSSSALTHLASIGHSCSKSHLTKLLAEVVKRAAVTTGVRGQKRAIDNSQVELRRGRVEGSNTSVINTADATHDLLVTQQALWWVRTETDFVDPARLAGDAEALLYKISDTTHVAQYHALGDVHGPLDPAAPPTLRAGAVHHTERECMDVHEDAIMATVLGEFVAAVASGTNVPMTLRCRGKLDWMARNVKAFVRPGAYESLAQQGNAYYEKSREPVWHRVHHNVTGHNAGTSQGTAGHLGGLFKLREAIPHVKVDVSPQFVHKRMCQLMAIVVRRDGAHFGGPRCNNPLLPPDKLGTELQELEACIAYFCEGPGMSAADGRRDGVGTARSDSANPACPFAAKSMACTRAAGLIAVAEADPSELSMAAALDAISAVAASAGVVLPSTEAGDEPPPTHTPAALHGLDDVAAPAAPTGTTPGSGWKPDPVSHVQKQGVRPPSGQGPSNTVKRTLYKNPPDSIVTMDQKLLAMAQKSMELAAVAGQGSSRGRQESAVRYINGMTEHCFMPGDLHVDGAMEDARARAYASYLHEHAVAAVGKRNCNFADVMNNLRAVRDFGDTTFVASVFVYLGDIMGRSDCPALGTLVDARGNLRLTVFARFYRRCVAKDAKGCGPDEDGGGASGDGSGMPLGYARNHDPTVQHRFRRCVGMCKRLPGPSGLWVLTKATPGTRGTHCRMRWDGYGQDDDMMYTVVQLHACGNYPSVAAVEVWVAASLAERTTAQVAADASLRQPHCEVGASTAISGSEGVPGCWVVGGSKRNFHKPCWQCGGCVDRQYVSMPAAKRHCATHHSDDPRLGAMLAQIGAGPPNVPLGGLVEGDLDEAVRQSSFRFYGQQQFTLGCQFRAFKKGQECGDSSLGRLRHKIALPLHAATGKTNYVWVSAHAIEMWEHVMSDLLRRDLTCQMFPVLTHVRGSTNDDVVEVASGRFKARKSQSKNQLISKAGALPLLLARVELSETLHSVQAAHNRKAASGYKRATLQRLVVLIMSSGVLSANGDASLSADALAPLVKTTARLAVAVCLVGGMVKNLLPGALNGSTGRIVRVELVGGTTLAEVEYNIGEGRVSVLVPSIDVSGWDLATAITATKPTWRKVGTAAAAEDDSAKRKNDQLDGLDVLGDVATAAAETEDGDAQAGSGRAEFTSGHGHLHLSELGGHAGASPTHEVVSLPDGHADHVDQVVSGTMPGKPGPDEAEDNTTTELDPDGSVLSAGLSAAMDLLAGRGRPKVSQTAKAASRVVKTRPQSKVLDMATYGWKLLRDSEYTKRRAGTISATAAKLEAMADVYEASDADGVYSPDADACAVTGDPTAWQRTPTDTAEAATADNAASVEAAWRTCCRAGWKGVTEAQRSQLEAAMARVTADLEAAVASVTGVDLADE